VAHKISEEHGLLTPAEVAALFRVDSKTITRWAKAGRIPRAAIVVTLGGHRRYRRSAIEALLNGSAR
jgi:excisionase family DNA binding protein